MATIFRRKSGSRSWKLLILAIVQMFADLCIQWMPFACLLAFVQNKSVTFGERISVESKRLTLNPFEPKFESWTLESYQNLATECLVSKISPGRDPFEAIGKACNIISVIMRRMLQSFSY